MKKILFAIALVMTMSFCANAQTDGWFQPNDRGFRETGGDINTGMPSAHGMDVEAPLGSGLIILGALGAGYAMLKKRD